jgi:hypothetical protein
MPVGKWARTLRPRRRQEDFALCAGICVDALRPAVCLVERQGFGDALELDGSERVEPHLAVAGALRRLLAHHHLPGLCIRRDPSRQIHSLSVDVAVLGDDRASVDSHVAAGRSTAGPRSTRSRPATTAVPGSRK